jgi:hypothetical protein
MNFAKWIHVRIQGWKGLATVLLPDQATVSDFKAMLGLEDSFGNVNVTASFLPLASETVLYDCVDEFDTVFIEP